MVSSVNAHASILAPQEHNVSMRIDLHCHSGVSDGTDSPAELIVAAAAAELDAVAITDHDTFAGVAEAKAAGRVHGVEVLGGIEITCESGGVTVHLLGYGADPDHTGLAEALRVVRQGRDERVPRIVAALDAAGVGVTLDDVLDQARPGTTLGRPHVADALVANGEVSDRQQAFDRWLDVGRPGYIGHEKIDLASGIALVRAAGGVAVLAHPWGRESRTVLTVRAIAELARAGLDGLEVDHQLHDAQTRSELRRVALAYDLIVTGGSDYHGTGKVNHDLGCNLTTEAGYRMILRRVGSGRA